MTKTWDSKTSFFASIGPVLTRFVVDVGSATLSERESITFPLDIQYVWRNPKLPVIYLAVSNGGPGKTGSDHQLIACSIDPQNGTLKPLGIPRDLPFRPLHLSLDRESEFLLTAYNNPSNLSVHTITDDGSIGYPIEQTPNLDFGIFGHQVLITPNGDTAIMPCRGYDPVNGQPEQPGSLKVFGYSKGKLTPKASIAPDGGYGFGARHLDYHPQKPLLYLAVERQSELQVFAMQNASIQPAALYKISTLSRPTKPPTRQATSAIHVHPNGQFVYISNRTYGTINTPTGRVVPDGEDNIAVFSINPENGQPNPIQHAPTHGSLPRTFSIHPSGKMLVATNSEVARKMLPNGSIKELPLSLVTFRIQNDGKLEETGIIEFSDKDNLLFWAGFL